MVDISLPFGNSKRGFIMKKIFCLVAMFIGMITLPLHAIADEQSQDLTFFGGFTTQSTILDVLKMFDANPTVTSINFKLLYSDKTSTYMSNSINYKNNINALTIGKSLDAYQFITTDTVIFKDGSKQKLYTPVLVATVKSVMLNQIPFDVQLTFRASKGHYFLNKEKAFITPKGIACLFYLDEMKLTTHGTEDALQLATKNNNQLLNAYDEKYIDYKAEYNDTLLGSGSDARCLLTGYDADNMAILIFKYVSSPQLEINYGPKDPVKSEDETYQNFLYNLQNKKNEQYNMNDKI